MMAIAQFISQSALWVRVVGVGVVLLGLWFGLGRAGFQGQARRSRWLAFAIPIVGWLATIWVLALADAFASRPPIVWGKIPAALLIGYITGLVILLRSKTMAAVLDAAPPSWLFGIQIVRFTGLGFLLPTLAGRMPASFGLPAGGGDSLVALLAIPVALYFSSGAPGRWVAAYAFNVFGMSVFALNLVIGLILFSSGHTNVALTSFPTVLLPTFGAPFTLLLHSMSIWQLRRLARHATSATASRPLTQLRLSDVN
jgi:hypothetical protein